MYMHTSYMYIHVLYSQPLIMHFGHIYMYMYMYMHTSISYNQPLIMDIGHMYMYTSYMYILYNQPLIMDIGQSNICILPLCYIHVHIIGDQICHKIFLFIIHTYRKPITFDNQEAAALPGYQTSVTSCIK